MTQIYNVNTGQFVESTELPATVPAEIQAELDKWTADLAALIASLNAKYPGLNLAADDSEAVAEQKLRTAEVSWNDVQALEFVAGKLKNMGA